MLVYPEIDPVAIQIGPLAVHWYGLMYVLAFLAAWLLLIWRGRSPYWSWSKDEISDFVFYAALGVVLGGRLGYVLFYNLPYYLAHPVEIFAVWQGGMSFHGGMLGVIVAGYLYTRKLGKSFLHSADFIVPVVPIGLGLGRLGNFINGELYGRVSNAPWAMVFPGGGPWPRHPSQLYELLLEGVLLFLLLWLYSARPRPRGAVFGLFLAGYGTFRFLVEFTREPDVQLGFIVGDFTMGQLLSLPMAILGLAIMVWAYKKHGAAPSRPA
ncbi:MAG: prolipoprotein diacylglyceryl transferase [Pseudomonadota bacterium]